MVREQLTARTEHRGLGESGFLGTRSRWRFALSTSDAFVTPKLLHRLVHRRSLRPCSEPARSVGRLHAPQAFSRPAK